MNHKNRQHLKLPAEIAAQLRELRRRLKRWVLIRGLSRWLLLVLAIIGFDILLDRFFKMDFAQRAIMLTVMLLLFAGLFLWRVVRPLMSRISDNGLLLEIENRHPELKENLISGAQLAQQSDLESKGVSLELANATIERSLELARRLDVSDTINQVENRKNAALLGTGLLLALALAAAVGQSSFFRTWFNRNIRLTSDQWPQATYLQIVGARDGELVLPRGVDHRLIVEVTEDSRIRDVDVFLEIDGAAGQTVHQMKPTGKRNGREHLFVMHNVTSEARLRARGGDDITSQVAIRLVEPPAIMDLQLSAVLPSYTRMPDRRLEGPGPHSLLAGSRVDGIARVNKKLQKFQLTSEGQVVNLQPADQEDVYQFQIPGTDQRLAGGRYEFSLVDEAGLASTRPSRFTINIKEDQPPRVRATLLGISGLAVPRARIPLSFNARDEYGLATVGFQANWKNADQEDSDSGKERALPIRKFPSGQEPVLQHQDVAVLDLEPLLLTPGTSFRLLIRATDTRPGQPNAGDSPEFLLRIVSEEELRADLLRREIEQRKAFQRAYDAQLEAMAELQAITATGASPLDRNDAGTDRPSRMIGLVRDQKLVGTSLAAIADQFEEFLVEVQNNRLDEETQKIAGAQTITDRFDNQIVQPIRALDAELIAVATRGLDNCRRLLNDQTGLAAAVESTTSIQQQILDEMQRIMAAMVDSENYQEVVNKLLEIKRGEDRIKSEINSRKEKRNETIIEEDIFDDD